MYSPSVNLPLSLAFISALALLISHFEYTADNLSTLPSTYLVQQSIYPDKQRVSLAQPLYQPDVSAVILNWSRFENVKQITALLCSPVLRGTIAAVRIHNNNPNIMLTLQDFSNANCPPNVLQIHNSPVNLLFEARFNTCASATTEYCFIQDDDYLVYPEIIMAMRSRMEVRDFDSPAIHLAPPNENLAAALREIRTDTQSTSFAWLGYGAMLRRSEAKDFLALLGALDVSEEERSMADNYFTILSNRVPETWFDQNLELGGGQPFTVGFEGDQRNWKHIQRAGQLLSQITSHPHLELPFTRRRVKTPPHLLRAPCAGTACMIESNLGLLQAISPDPLLSAERILEAERDNLRKLDRQRQKEYTTRSLSKAVDGQGIATAFCTSTVADNTYIVLDVLHEVHAAWRGINFVWVSNTKLRNIQIATSSDGTFWTSLDNPLVICTTIEEKNAFECSVPVPAHLGKRFFGLQFTEGHLIPTPFCVHDIWLRGYQYRN